MKNLKNLKFSLTLFIFGLMSILLKPDTYAQCTDLFFSEYVEGSYNNKAMEIYNPTANTIQLSNYQIKRYANGATTAPSNYSVTLSGSIAPYKTKVIVIDKRNPSGVGQDTIVFAGLIAKADTFVCPDYDVSSALYHNGDDAMTLEKISPPGIVDIFGEIGIDPGTAWDSIAPYNDDIGTYITKDRTLIRKSSVKKGVDKNPGSPTNPANFNPLAEYDALPKNTFDSLGFHRCECGTAGISEDFQSVNIYIFPNPVKDKHFDISSTEDVTNIKLMSVLGQMILTLPVGKTKEVISVNVSSLPNGLYFLRTELKDGRGILSKIMIQ